MVKLPDLRKGDFRETPAPTGSGGPRSCARHSGVTALRVLGEGLQLPLDPALQSFRIGRDGPPLTELRMPYPSVSMVHARVTRTRYGGLEITDEGSKNGLGAPMHRLNWTDYQRVDRVLVDHGDRFALGAVRLLALDEPTAQLAKPLTAYAGPGAHAEVDRVIAAASWGDLVILRGTHADEVDSVARTLHHHSNRKDQPFLRVDRLPKSEAQCEELRTRTGSGTVFLDLTRSRRVPRRLLDYLWDRYFWTIAVAASEDELDACLGNAWLDRPLDFECCTLGFPRTGAS